MTRPAAPADPARAALLVWLLSRAGVAVLVLGGARLLAGAPAGDVPGFLSRWDRWDVGLLRKVAEFGYAGYPDRYPDQGIEAFFPGFPLVLALVHRVVPDWTAAGLLISLVAGAVAAVWLARLAALDGLPGDRAVLVLVLSPYAVFLAAGYSESLFLALALPAWWCGRQGPRAGGRPARGGRLPGAHQRAVPRARPAGPPADPPRSGRGATPPGSPHPSPRWSPTPRTCTPSPATGCAGCTRRARAGGGRRRPRGRRCGPPCRRRPTPRRARSTPGASAPRWSPWPWACW